MNNHHESESAKVGLYYTDKTLATDADVIAMGLVEATLALAYEQRTANLIALWSNPTSTLAGTHARHEPSYIGWGVGEETLGSLLLRILERLDVQDDGTVK